MKNTPRYRGTSHSPPRLVPRS